MVPGTLRYPGGTIANYWNWVTGWYGTRPSGGNGSEYNSGAYHFSLQDLKQMVTASGATPIFDVNIMTATLNSQVAMLNAADQLGLPVRFIELGNEFYLPKPDYVHAFPTPLSYAQRVAAWIPVLHKDFPNAQIAAVGYAQILQPSQRESDWNTTLLKTVPKLQTITMHVYLHPRSAFGVAGSQNPDKVLTLPFSQWALLEKHSLQTLPSNITVWVTEFNMMNKIKGPNGEITFPPPQGTWTQGLFAGTMDLLFLRDPRIKLADYYTLVGNYGSYEALNPATGQPSLTGTVQQLIHRAAAGMTFSEPMAFSGEPMLLSKYPGLIGCVFRNSSGTADAVVLNLTNQTISLQLPAALSKTMIAQEIQGAPSTVQASKLQSTQVRTSKTMTLPPYAAAYIHPESRSQAN